MIMLLVMMMLMMIVFIIVTILLSQLWENVIRVVTVKGYAVQYNSH